MTYATAPECTVLVVENNILLKMFIADLIEDAGFIVIQVCDADEAITILEGHSDISLLVTNVVMYGSMNGVELAHAVDTRWPSIPIIVVSGKPGLSQNDLPLKSVLFDKPYHDEQFLFWKSRARRVASQRVTPLPTAV